MMSSNEKIMMTQPISATPATEGLPGEGLDEGPASRPRKGFVPRGLSAFGSVGP